MPVYVFQCPVCKMRFKMTIENPSALLQKKFTCTKCHYSAPFTTVIKELALLAPQPQPAPQPKPQNNTTQPDGFVPGGETHVVTAQPKAYLTVAGTGSRFVVTPGTTYVLGRRSSDSTANLQLAPDISLSRTHARLAVQMVGGRLMAQIMGIKANNPVIVNGKPLAPGQPCTLKNGDRLQLGLTHVLFNL